MNVTITQINGPTITVATAGSISGPAGPQGPAGPSGTPGSTIVFTQASAAATWVIAHNMGVYPSIVVADSAGTVVEGGIHHDSVNQVTLSFSSAFAGVAYLV